MRNFYLVLLLLVVGPLVGCGGGVDSGPVTGEAPPSQQDLDKPSTMADMKARLNEVAESGQGGSALSGLQAAIEELKTSDAPLADKLMKDYEALVVMTDPAKIKSAARAMADKL